MSHSNRIKDSPTAERGQKYLSGTVRDRVSISGDREG